MNRPIRVLIAAFAVFFIAFSVSGQETYLPADVGVFADQIASFVVRTLADVAVGNVQVAVEPLTRTDAVTPLGELLALSISIRLANSSTGRFTVVDTAGIQERASQLYLVSGRLFVSETAVFGVVQVIDGRSRRIIRGTESGFAMSDWVSELLRAPPVVVRVESGGEDPFEPDSRLEPYTLSSGETVEARNLTSADEDWYAFTVPDARDDGLLTVGTTGKTDTYIAAYGPDNIDKMLADNDDAWGRNAEVTIAVEPGQKYWFMVSGFDPETTGEYSIYANLVPFGGDPLEPNDRAQDATPIVVGADPLESMLIPGSDEDWFVFDLGPLTGTENVVSIETSGTLDTYIELLDSAGRLLLENDDGGTGDNGRIDAFSIGSGRYFVRVRHYDGSNQGRFALSANLIRADPDEWEPDNTQEQASRVPNDGTRQIRNFTPSDEVDWIEFTIQATQTVEIRTTGDIDTIIVLYDRFENVVAKDDDSGVDFNARIEQILERGTYHLEVRQVSEGSVFGGEYGVSVHAF